MFYYDNPNIDRLKDSGICEVLLLAFIIAERRFRSESRTGDTCAAGLKFRSFVLDALNAILQNSSSIDFGFTSDQLEGVNATLRILLPGEILPVLTGLKLGYWVDDNVPHYRIGDAILIIASARNGIDKVACDRKVRQRHRQRGYALQPELPFIDDVDASQGFSDLHHDAQDCQPLVLLYTAPNEEEAGECWLAIPANEPGKYYEWSEIVKLGGRTNPKEPDRLYPKQSVQSTLDKDEDEFLVGSMDETGNGQGQVAGGSRQ